MSAEPSHAVEVRTPRLVLRRMTEGDLDEWHRAVFADPGVMRFLPPREPLPRDVMEERLRRLDEHWAEHGFGVWGVVLPERDEVIGHCGLRAVDEWPGDVEVLYALGRQWWGNGYATEAARASVRVGFERLRLPRVVGFVLPENAASRRVLEKAGMTLRGETRLFDLDLVWYAAEREAGSAPPAR